MFRLNRNDLTKEDVINSLTRNEYYKEVLVKIIQTFSLNEFSHDRFNKLLKELGINSSQERNNIRQELLDKGFHHGLNLEAPLR